MPSAAEAEDAEAQDLHWKPHKLKRTDVPGFGTLGLASA